MDPILPLAKHFLNKKFIVTFVTFLVIGAGAYAYVWQYQNDLASQEVVPTFTPRADVTADWKTYTNTQYGFEVKYPEGFFFENQTKNSNYFFIKNLDSEIYYGDRLGPLESYTNKGFFVQIYVDKLSEFETPNKDGFNNWIGIRYPRNMSTNVSEYNVAGNIGYKFYLDYGSNTQSPRFLIFHNGNGYEFSFNSSENKDGLNVYNQILSTFKFTDSVQGTHCGGNIKNAPTCPTGYTCKLNISMPDTGGTCVATSQITCPAPQYVSPQCPKLITKAKNSQTGETKTFPDGCLPLCWQALP